MACVQACTELLAVSCIARRLLRTLLGTFLLPNAALETDLHVLMYSIYQIQLLLRWKGY